MRTSLQIHMLPVSNRVPLQTLERVAERDHQLAVHVAAAGGDYDAYAMAREAERKERDAKQQARQQAPEAPKQVRYVVRWLVNQVEREAKQEADRETGRAAEREAKYREAARVRSEADRVRNAMAKRAKREALPCVTLKLQGVTPKLAYARVAVKLAGATAPAARSACTSELARALTRLDPNKMLKLRRWMKLRALLRVLPATEH